MSTGHQISTLPQRILLASNIMYSRAFNHGKWLRLLNLPSLLPDRFETLWPLPSHRITRDPAAGKPDDRRIFPASALSRGSVAHVEYWERKLARLVLGSLLAKSTRILRLSRSNGKIEHSEKLFARVKWNSRRHRRIKHTNRAEIGF